MARLQVPPTRSNLLALKRQLAFAVEGYDLLEQKRQILLAELMTRAPRVRAAAERLGRAARVAFEALQEALVEGGREAMDQAALGVAPAARCGLSDQRVLGLALPKVTNRPATAEGLFGVGETAVHTEPARRLFVDLLPVLIEWAELENAVVRLSRELRKTQRRCNALSRVFIPAHEETLAYIVNSIEERERESLSLLRIVRDRLAEGEA